MNSNCLATSIKDFCEPRITSIEVFNHIQIIKEIKKTLNEISLRVFLFKCLKLN